MLVTVRAQQLTSTFSVLLAIKNGADARIFGNTADHVAEITVALGSCALFGVPAVGGVRAGPVVTYALISQQKTMLDG